MNFDMMDMPSEFWKTLSAAENDTVFETGKLNHLLCCRLWAMLGRTDKAPHELAVFVKEEDLQRLIASVRKN